MLCVTHPSLTDDTLHQLSFLREGEWANKFCLEGGPPSIVSNGLANLYRAHSQESGWATSTVSEGVLVYRMLHIMKLHIRN